MAGVFRKSLLSSAKLIGRQLVTSNAICASRTSMPVTLSSPSFRNFSMLNPSRALAGAGLRSNTCGCCGLHTEVDKELSTFLDKEIKFEESTSKSKAGLPKIPGFEVSADESQVTLTRKGDVSLKVTFNINGSADSDQMPQIGDTPPTDEDVQMISKPPFTVELDKGSGEVLAFQCAFSPSEDMEQESGEQGAEAIVDQFEIQEVSIHQGDWKETVYTLPAETMDGNLYDLLMDMLDERGINDEFINNFVEFSTAYEHGKYLGFLKNLKSFVEK
ncbi:complement component 1 Q subcomponent-binding protein, mitochondrial-like [Haliotis cracherodii]|uniref:complement component 1 Q subcomponent-binding protein, mitochondrial-like n=1 Tax=Haliotis cracherodii TaxID=6455 RepID=UPI0039EA7BB4